MKFPRTQVDDLQNQYSRDSMLDTTDRPDMTRQELKDDADINILLRRHGLNQQSRPLQFGEYDYTIDYQQALDSVTTAQKAYNRMPIEIRDKYPNLSTMLSAMATGELATDLEKLTLEKNTAAEAAALQAEIDKEDQKTRIKVERMAEIVKDRYKADPGNFETKNPKGNQQK